MSQDLFSDTSTPEPTVLTPVEQVGNFYFKRDDYYTFNNVNGGKVRSALELCKYATKGLVTAGSRKSPQIQIVSEIAKYRQLPFVAVVPFGELTPELTYAKNNGAIIQPIKMGFNNNIIKKAKIKAIELDYTYVPFGMEDEKVIQAIAAQIENIPTNINRIVMSVGSGMTLSGILHGLVRFNLNKKVLGIMVGANPLKRLNKYAPYNWQKMCELIKSNVDYHREIKDNVFCGIELDQIYEAKCIPFIKEGDLFWIIGKGIRS